MSIFTVCAVAFVCACASLTVRETGQRESAALLGVAFLVGCAVCGFERLSGSFREITSLISQSNVGGYLTVLLKVFGIAFVTDIGSDTVRGLGEDSVAKGIEFAGKAEMLWMCVPAMTDLMKLSLSLLGQTA